MPSVGRALSGRTSHVGARAATSVALGAAIGLSAIAAVGPTGAAGERERGAKCERELTDLALPGCEVLFSDTAEEADAASVWGRVECVDSDRARRIETGGDPHATSTGVLQQNDAYRETRVRDGDDFFGERCELGRNDHRSGPTALFREGDRRATFASYRLPKGYPLASERWQVVMQIKQSSPSANSGGTPVLELEAKRGSWRLLQSTKPGRSSGSRELWSVPAETEVWTRFAFDARYSRKKGKGTLRAYVDLDGDGDAGDAIERSPRFKTYTLKKETGGGDPDDGVKRGRSIPSHLRVGIYHDPAIDCGENTCAVDVDNVQVVDTR